MAKHASHQPPMALLRDCLSLSDDPEALRQLRLTLLSQPSAWEGLCTAAAETRLAPAIRARLIARGLMPPSHPSRAGAMSTPGGVFDEFEQRHVKLRNAEKTVLDEIVTALNGAGIEPLLIKGARVLWQDFVPWRTMRDLDLIIARGLETKALAVLAKIGLVTWGDARNSAGHHHLPALHRPGLDFLVELHCKAANRYGEPFLPTSEIWQRSVQVERVGLVVRLLPEPEEIWHNLIHNHIGHSGFARGLIDIKGLYEFAIAYSGLDVDGRARVMQLACRNPVGLAAFDLWLAAAQDGFGLTMQQGDVLHADAVEIWQNICARLDGISTPTGKYPGYRETLKLSLSADRISRVATHTGRSPVATRLSAIRVVLPRFKRVD